MNRIKTILSTIFMLAIVANVGAFRAKSINVCAYCFHSTACIRPQTVKCSRVTVFQTTTMTVEGRCSDYSMTIVP